MMDQRLHELLVLLKKNIENRRRLEAENAEMFDTTIQCNRDINRNYQLITDLQDDERDIRKEMEQFLLEMAES